MWGDNRWMFSRFTLPRLTFIRLLSCALVIAGSLVIFSASPASARAPRWAWPVMPVTVERGYVAPLTEYGPGHRGIDVRALPGTPVHAPMDARVSFAGIVVDRPVITLVPRLPGDGASDWAVSFEAVQPNVTAGDNVDAGAVIGNTVASSHCSCLHIGTRWRGGYVSPLLVFGSIPRAVLLPW